MPGDELLEAHLCLLTTLVTGPKCSHSSVYSSREGRHQGKTIREGLAQGGDVKWECGNIVGYHQHCKEMGACWQLPHHSSSLQEQMRSVSVCMGKGDSSPFSRAEPLMLTVLPQSVRKIQQNSQNKVCGWRNET